MAKLAITYYMKNGSILQDTCNVADHESIDSAIQDRVKQSEVGLQGSKARSMISDTLAVASSEVAGVRFNKCMDGVTIVHANGETFEIGPSTIN